MKPSLQIVDDAPRRAGNHPERAAGSGFESGELIATTAPGSYGGEAVAPVASDVFDAGELLEILLLGARDAEAVGCRAVFLAFVLKSPRGPQSLRELGSWLDCSHVTAMARLNAFKSDFAREFQHRLTTPGIGERCIK